MMAFECAWWGCWASVIICALITLLVVFGVDGDGRRSSGLPVYDAFPTLLAMPELS